MIDIFEFESESNCAENFLSEYCEFIENLVGIIEFSLNYRIFEWNGTLKR